MNQKEAQTFGWKEVVVGGKRSFVLEGSGGEGGRGRRRIKEMFVFVELCEKRGDVCCVFGCVSKVFFFSGVCSFLPSFSFSPSVHLILKFSLSGYSKYSWFGKRRKE